VFPAQDDPVSGQIAYREFVATRARLSEAGVSLHPLPVATDSSSEAAAEQEAQLIRELLRQTWTEDATRKVAVLVRSRDHLSALVALLRSEESAWHFSAVEIDSLLGRQVIQDLLALVRALHHRADRVNWLAILRAPWCGLRLADLHALVAQSEATVWHLMSDATRLACLSTEGQVRLLHVRRILSEAFAGQGRQRLRRWVADVWCLLGGPQCLQQASDASDVSVFFERLDMLDAAGRFDLDRLEDDMRHLYAAPDTAADGRLQLMTIHKAKGLEFDTVIVPGLHRSPGTSEASLLAWDTVLIDGEEHLVAAPVNPRGTKNAGTTSYDYLRRLERQRAENEEARVLYVAATRAIRHLHLVGVLAPDGAGEIKAPRGNTLMARLWPAFEAVAATAMTEPVERVEPLTPLAEFVPSLQRLACLPAPMPAVSQPECLAAEVGGDEDAAPQTLAAAVGVLVHAVLEQIARRSSDWPLDSFSSREANLRAWLRGRGWSQDDAREGAHRAIDMLQCSLQSPDGQWLLRERPGAAAELALTKVGAGGTAQTRVMDRSFIEAGVRWIIDYKTASLPGEPDEAQFQAHAGRYRAQLSGYAELFRDEGLPIRCAVFYVAYGKRVTLD
jgi:ATP-dependent exoDNAse (exonuclease V) beta subunit